MTSDGERWRTIKAIFGEVAALPSAERPARLAALTMGDPALQAEVAALLAADGAVGRRFEQLPPGLLADLPRRPADTPDPAA
ncbi:MAG: hypothetical protein R2882_16025 [Gemmatimonadales bacterium]